MIAGALHPGFGAGQVLVRPAAPGDEGSILRLIRALAAFEETEGPIMASEETLCLALFAPPPALHALIAEVDGKAMGVALWTAGHCPQTGEPVLFLDELFVEPEVRGHGAGRALFAGMAQAAIASDCQRIDWSVLDWNRAAHQFFISLGARRGEGWEPWRLEGAALEVLAAASICIPPRDASRGSSRGWA